MKKLFNLITVAITVLFLTVSCVKTVLDPTVVVVNPGYYTPSSYVVPQNPDGEFAITFGGYHAATKAIADGGVSGVGYDNFNLFAWNSANDIIMNPYLVQAIGVGAYDYTGVTGQELKYFKNNTSNYDFIGVIPTTKTSTLNSGAVTVKDVVSFTSDDNRVSVNYPTEDLTADSPEEFLWSYKQIAKSEYGNLVTLPFNHGNALLYLGFKSDRDDTEILDYTPSTPEVPATPDTETYTKKTVKFIDELAAGNEVQVGIGFYGTSSPKLTKTNPNPLYVGADNTANGYLAKTWLLSIMDAVNAQFVYYRLDQVSNSTSKSVTTEDWESAASNKNIFMMKLADGVDKAAFAAGNDAFATALKAHQTDWYGGSPAESFWAMFEQAYADGWRVIRINVNDTNANQVLVFLSSNLDINTQVCEITPGTPYQPAVVGLDGIRVFSATYDTDHYAHVAHTTVADASISATGCTYTSAATTTDVIPFSLPATTTFGSVQYSPTTFYAIPADPTITHFVVKFSYTYNGVTVYDVRVPLILPAGGLEAGKYYKYVINITSTANGTDDPDEANTDQDEIDVVNNPITVTITLNDYGQGNDTEVTI